MMTDAAAYQLTVDQSDTVVVGRVSGEIDHGNAAEFQAAVLDELRTGPLILDLSRLEFIDSAGLAAIESVRRTTPLRVVVAPESIVYRAFEIVGLDHIIPTYTSVDAARAQVAEGV
jgi:anti-anti-sigma factor